MFRIFFPPAGLTSADKKLLLLLATAFFIAHYDMSVLSLALPDMQRSFNISEQDLGKVIGAARLGALPAIFLALLSDRIGRRRLLMVTLLGLSVATGRYRLCPYQRGIHRHSVLPACVRYRRGNHRGYLCAGNVAGPTPWLGCGISGGNGRIGLWGRIAALRAGRFLARRLAGALCYRCISDSLFCMAASLVARIDAF